MDAATLTGLAGTGLPATVAVVAVILAVAALLLRRVRGRGPGDPDL